MKRILKAAAALAVAATVTAAMTFVSAAGQWKLDGNGWWYQNDDGSWTSNGWQMIDGQYYYFNGSGYMLANTTTPDGYYVGPDGAWVQGAAAAASSSSSAAASADYSGSYQAPNGTRYNMYLTLTKTGADTYAVNLETEHGGTSTFANTTGTMENGVLKFSNTANTNFRIDFSGWGQGYFVLYADQQDIQHWDKTFYR